MLPRLERDLSVSRSVGAHLPELFIPGQSLPSALCAQSDPELWFPERGGSSVEAKRICMRCPERVDCLEGALERSEQYGIFGGLSERERARIRRQRRAGERAA